ncbi:MAG TPA: DUF2723 domain-containing protein, partial [Acidimicrobiia bacterium]|nr:DUF2723 domain-containing protein [Acidimicrobiia bacterium]
MSTTRRTSTRNKRRSVAKAAADVQLLDARDWRAAALVTSGALVLFAATFSPSVGLGDAPETVTGIKSLGILHAPGYATYVVSARLFGEVVRLGSWSFRVNLFSVVCAAVAIGLSSLLARGFGAGRAGAGIAAFILASSASFWFNAGFAKHFAFSGLLFTATAFCIVLYRQRRRTRLLVFAGVLLGAGVGASWQVLVVLAIGLVALLAVERPRPSLRATLAAAAAGVVSGTITCAFIVLRAAQDPAMNFGGARTAARLAELLSTSDFRGTTAAGTTSGTNVVGGAGSYFAVVARDLGLGAITLAIIGAFVVWQRRQLGPALFFLVVGLGNILAVSTFPGADLITGFYTVLARGAHVLGAAIVVTILAGIGATRVFDWARDWGSEHDASWARNAAIVVVIAAVIVPSVIVHYTYANPRTPTFADMYARAALQDVAPHGVFLAAGWEFAQPLVYSQTVEGERRDVVVLSVDTLTKQWYRDQVVERFGLDPKLRTLPDKNLLPSVISILRLTRPVYIDTYLAQYLGSAVGYSCAGLACEIVDGQGPVAAGDVRARSQALHAAELHDGLLASRHAQFPNYIFYFFHER